MATRLLQIVTFLNVAGGATVGLPHTLNIAGTPVTPDYVVGDVGGFSISATSTTVTVTNDGADLATINVWLERKHTEIRELGGGIDNLTPQPFVAGGGGSGGGGGPTFTLVTALAVPVGTSPTQVLITAPITVAIGRKLVLEAIVTANCAFGDGPASARIITQVQKDPDNPFTRVLLAEALYESTATAATNSFWETTPVTVEDVGDGTPHTYGIWVDTNPVPSVDVQYEANRCTLLLIETNV